MKRGEAFPNKWLNTQRMEEITGSPEGTLVLTIAKVGRGDFNGKAVRACSFKEIPETFTLNGENWDKLSEITREDDDQKFAGHVVEFYIDPEVEYRGKAVGGIRIRKAPHGTAPYSGPADTEGSTEIARR